MIGRKPKLKEKLIEKNSNEADEQFIFFDFQKEKKFLQQIEIQAILNSNNSYKVMVIVDGKSTLDYLCMKIAEQMEKFHEYTNLEGLKAINLTKKAEKGVIKIPSSGELKDYLTGGDIIYCDLTTQEYWVKTNIKIFSSYSKMIINLDLKFRLETIFKKLKFLLIKLGTNFWIDYTKGKKDSFHYTFVNAKFKTMKSKNNFELNINDINKSIQIESMKLKDVFDFYSEISCNVNLISLEELLFNELKNAPLETNSMNKLRLNEFREMSFDTLINDKKYEPEKKYIMKYIKRLIRSQNNLDKSFYVYNKNYSSKSSNRHDIMDDEDFIMSINESESANLIISPEQVAEHPNESKDQNFSGTKSKIKSGEEQFLYPDNNSYNYEDEENLEENSIDKDFKSKAGKSFLENSRIIHEFHRNNSSFIDNKSCTSNDNDNFLVNKLNHYEKKRCSMDESILKNSPVRHRHNLSDNLATSEVKKLDNQIDMRIDLNEDCEFHHNHIGVDIEKSGNKNGLNENPHLETLENDPVDAIDDCHKLCKPCKHLSHKLYGELNHYPCTTNPRNVSPPKFASIFSKMRDTSKYSNLCSEFRIYLTLHRFIDIMNSYTTLKFCKNTLERVCIPQFRDVNIQSEVIDTETKNYSVNNDEEDGPISYNNKRILLFILGLITIFTAAILYIFLSN